MLDIIKRRRSVRRYTKQDVTDEEVRQLLEAAMAAPSANNLQPWSFVVVREPQLRQALAKTHVYARMAADAPVVFVVCADPARSPHHWLEDASAATENLLLQASAMGLGAVWVACQPDSGREDYVRQILNIPADIRVVCLVPVGHPAEHPSPRTQYDPNKVFNEVYGARPGQ